MSTAESGRPDGSADHVEAEIGVSRRQALGRLGAYTAPVLLALVLKRTAHNRRHFRQRRAEV